MFPSYVFVIKNQRHHFTIVDYYILQFDKEGKHFHHGDFINAAIRE